MNALLLPVLLAALAITVLGLTPELAKKAAEAREKCKDVPKYEEDSSSNDQKEDCHAACFMKEMGYMTDGEVNLPNMVEANKQKWDDPEMVKQGIFVDTSCAKRVGASNGRKECAIGYLFITCKTQLVKETGLQPPTPVTSQ